MNEGQTHWEGCHEHHLECALAKLAEAQRERDTIFGNARIVVADAILALPELQEMMRDAERYRWLRIEGHRIGVQFPLKGPADLDRSIDDFLYRADEAIDAAKEAE